jgi:hypothetical protein
LPQPATHTGSRRRRQTTPKRLANCTHYDSCAHRVCNQFSHKCESCQGRYRDEWNALNGNPAGRQECRRLELVVPRAMQLAALQMQRQGAFANRTESPRRPR